jgi:hypothetical protein
MEIGRGDSHMITLELRSRLLPESWLWPGGFTAACNALTPIRFPLFPATLGQAVEELP